MLTLAARTSGCLTGTRLAGVLGQAIMLDCIESRHKHWKPHGFPVKELRLCLCSWIDNLYSFSSTLFGAIAILEDIEQYLGTKWALHIKPSSRACMVCRGNAESPIDPVKWPLRLQMNVLGHMVQYDCGIGACWHSTRAGLWGAYWKNAASCEARNLGFVAKASLLQRTVVAKFAWKLSRWPFQKTVAVELDALQCRMVCYLLKCPRLAHESIDSYCRRRARDARNLCKQVGFWSELWAKRVVDWNDHVQRGGAYNHICFPLVNFKNEQWLMHRRAFWVPTDSSSTRNTLLAGRTGTRNNIGRPQTRWAHGVVLAKEVMAGRTITEKGNNAMTIGTRIRNAFQSLASRVHNRTCD